MPGRYGRHGPRAQHGDAVPEQEQAQENSRQRVARLAGEFEGHVPGEVGRSFTRDELLQAWESFCTGKGEPSSGFSSILYKLQLWRVIKRTSRRNHFELASPEGRGFRKRRPADRSGALMGEPPRMFTTEFTSPVQTFRMPSELYSLRTLDVQSMQKKVQKLLNEKGLQPMELTEENYAQYQHYILFVEELQMKYDIALYDLHLEQPFKYTRQRDLYWIDVPGLAEKRPSVLRGDPVLVVCADGRFTGFVHGVFLDHIEVSFHQNFRNRPPFAVHFDFSRTPVRIMHRAIDEVLGDFLSDDPIQRPNPEPHAELNREQSEFLTAAVQPLRPTPGCDQTWDDSFPPVLLLWGPPGTGKTTTVVHTIHAVLQRQRDARILVAAPSNPAADLLCERLASVARLGMSEMLRLVAVSRNQRDISPAAQQYTKYDGLLNCFKVPTMEELKTYKVVVATCGCSGYIRSSFSAEMENGWFSHIFLDEAAQAMEAEALVPFTLGAPGVRRFLAGDQKQLGPVIRSPVSIKYGLDTSLMERITKCISVQHSRVFTLLQTYRAHPSILKLYNEAVYCGLLQCRSGRASCDMEAWPNCPRDARGSPHPVIFHHCNGQETRTADSPSWMNAEEMEIVQQYLMQLLAYGVSAEDIGIMSPYHKQCARLRFMCRGEGVSVEVGTTELFQGREKRVIILSTVRSKQQDQITADLRFSLGFLGNYKRTNVALSRAKSLLIVVGNLELLSRDEQWNQVIRLVQRLGPSCVKGPPFTLQRTQYRDGGVQNGQAAVAALNGSDGVMDRPWREPM